LFLPLVLAGCLLAPARGVQTQRNDGWVTDQAGLLNDAQERGLEALMESYKQGSTHEIALLTVKNLGGDSIENLALKTAREWGIGTEATSNGALLVISLEDREMRIEVGRGLEGELTDSICGRIIRNIIAPEFKRQRYYEGLHAGVVAMHRAAGGDYGALQQSRRGRSGQGGIGGCFSMLFFVMIFGSIFRRGGRGGRGGGLMGVLPLWMMASAMSGSRRGGGLSSGGFSGGGGGFSGFGGGGGFSGGGASGGW
jgi:uncharacterized protein